MPLMASEGESKPKQQPPTGTHAARCYSVIDMGTQTLEYMGAKKSLHKIRIGWELPEELTVFTEEKGEQPFSIQKDYTLSLYEKANLRHDLESWRGKAFTADELKGFDIFTLLGAPCMLTIIHKTSDGGKVYANVTSISKPPKGMKVPPQVNENIQFSIDEGRSIAYNALPEWLRDKIAKCDEWQENEPAQTDPTDEREVDPFNEGDPGDPLPF